MKLFKKGDKVRVTDNGGNDSYNSGKLGMIQGIYKNFGWAYHEYEIEGTVKLHNSIHCPSISHSYLLTLNGKEVGYVYNTALELVPEKKKVFQITSMFDQEKGIWFDFKSIIILDDIKVSNVMEDVYLISWNDKSELYKGYIK